MDRGIWILRCQTCGKDFELELQPGERVVEYAKEAACPHCYNVPVAKLESNLGLWHHIIGFKTSRTD